MSEFSRTPTTTWDGQLRPTSAKAASSVQIIEVPAGGSHQMEPEHKRMSIGPDHILYPLMVSLALFPLLMGASGHHLADDLPDDETHPFFPDHFWTYPVIMVVMFIAVGLLSALVAQNMQLEQSADPRTVVLPRPDWYFLFLFQFLKLPLGNEVINSIIIPTIIVLLLLLWPFLDQLLGPRLARAMHWQSWPVPGRNMITGSGWILFLGLIVLLTFWSVFGWTLFGISGG